MTGGLVRKQTTEQSLHKRYAVAWGINSERLTVGVGRRGRSVHQRQPEQESLYQSVSGVGKFRASRACEVEFDPMIGVSPGTSVQCRLSKWSRLQTLPQTGRRYVRIRNGSDRIAHRRCDGRRANRCRRDASLHESPNG